MASREPRARNPDARPEAFPVQRGRLGGLSKGVAMKCWYIYTKDDESEDTDLVWSLTVSQAKHDAYFSADVDWTSLRAKRVPKLDGDPYPTDKAIHEAGFVVMCHQCFNDSVFDPVFNDEGEGFCDEVCLSRWRQKQAIAQRG